MARRQGRVAALARLTHDLPRRCTHENLALRRALQSVARVGRNGTAHHIAGRRSPLVGQIPEISAVRQRGGTARPLFRPQQYSI